MTPKDATSYYLDVTALARVTPPTCPGIAPGRILKEIGMTMTMTMIMKDDETRADNWNDGALDGCRNAAKRSSDPDYLDGYRHGRDQRRVRVVMPNRPEGYYHAPLPAAGAQ